MDSQWTQDTLEMLCKMHYAKEIELCKVRMSCGYKEVWEKSFPNNCLFRQES